MLEIGEKLLKNPFSFFVVHQKGSKSIFLERNTNFFVNDARFARKHFWVHSKLVGTPCTRPVHAPFELQGLALCTKPSDFGHLIFIGTQSQRNFLKSTILTTAYERHTELLWTNLNATFLRSLLVVHHLFQTSKSDLVTPLASSLLPNVKKWF